MKNIFKLFSLIVVIYSIDGCTKGGEPVSLSGDVYKIEGLADSKQLVPAATRTATGSLLGWYDDKANVFVFTLNWNDIWTSGAKDVITGVKFYGPAAPGSNGSLIHSINFENSTNLTGTINLTLSGNNGLLDPEKANLFSGKWYYVICTTLFPEGIIRGQLTAQKRDPSAESIIPVTNVSWDDANNYVLKKGDKATLKAGVEPSFASNKTLTWTSSDPSVASVDQMGVVTAIGAGFTTITAVANDGSNIKATSQIVVNYKLEDTELSRSGWSVTSSSQQVDDGGGAVAILDGSIATYWTNQWKPSNAPLPHWLLVDMKQGYNITKVVVRRRTGNTDTKTVVIQTSIDNTNFVNAGTLSCTADVNSLSFSARNVRYVKLTITESNRSPQANVAEVYISEAKWVLIP